MKTLKDLKVGETSKIRAWVCFDGMLGRLIGLGLTIGAEVKVLRKGWFRPIHIQVGMTEMFIRSRDASNIWVDGVD
jgi:Fe2+ transport system protein FeoA